MSSILEDKKRRNADYIVELGYPGASIVSGVSEAALRGLAVPAVDGGGSVAEDSSTALDAVEAPGKVPADDVRVAAEAAQTDGAVQAVPSPSGTERDAGSVRVQTPYRSEEVPVAERKGVLSFVMGGNVVEIEDGSSISTGTFAMAMDAAMGDDFDEILISLGDDKKKGASVLMAAGDGILEEMLGRKPIAIAVDGIRFRPGTPTAAGRFLASCAEAKTAASGNS